ncbi:MAG: enoyl-CoA hydratase/isomerase family protein [Polyangiaceae bacterium]
MKTLTMTAPGKNALGTQLMTWLITELREAAGEPVILTGAGDAFSAGLNLKEVVSLDRPGMAHYLHLLESMVDAIYNYPGPTIAWVNGHAIAGGCVIALACDHRLVKNDPAIRIGLNETQNGLQLPPKTGKLVRHRVPAHSLDRVVLGGALYSPDVALRLGLIDEIVTSEADVHAYAAQVAKAPPAAYALAKETLRKGVLHVSEAEQKHFIAETVPLWTSDELKIKLAAILKK